MFESTAKVEYHTNWVIAICDNGLLEYYRRWVWLKSGLWIHKPMNGAHISLVRGDIETGKWERNLDGETIKFNYMGNLECHENYIWLPVFGDDLGRIRENIGLSKMPKKPFHMTVGNVPMNLKCILQRSI